MGDLGTSKAIRRALARETAAPASVGGTAIIVRIFVSERAPGRSK